MPSWVAQVRVWSSSASFCGSRAASRTVLGCAGDGRLDKIARQAHDLRLVVDRGARVAQQRLGASQRHAHADLGKQPQRLLVNVLDGRLVEHAQARARRTFRPSSVHRRESLARLAGYDALL